VSEERSIKVNIIERGNITVSGHVREPDLLRYLDNYKDWDAFLEKVEKDRLIHDRNYCPFTFDYLNFRYPQKIIEGKIVGGWHKRKWIIMDKLKKWENEGWVLLVYVTTQEKFWDMKPNQWRLDREFIPFGQFMTEY